MWSVWVTVHQKKKRGTDVCMLFWGPVLQSSRLNGFCSPMKSQRLQWECYAYSQVCRIKPYITVRASSSDSLLKLQGFSLFSPRSPHSPDPAWSPILLTKGEWIGFGQCNCVASGTPSLQETGWVLCPCWPRIQRWKWGLKPRSCACYTVGVASNYIFS